MSYLAGRFPRGATVGGDHRPGLRRPCVGLLGPVPACQPRVPMDASARLAITKRVRGHGPRPCHTPAVALGVLVP